MQYDENMLRLRFAAEEDAAFAVVLSNIANRLAEADRLALLQTENAETELRKYYVDEYLLGLKWLLQLNTLQELEREYRGQMENDEGFMWQNLQRMQLTLRAPLIPAEKERCKLDEQDERMAFEKMEIAHRLLFEQDFRNPGKAPAPRDDLASLFVVHSKSVVNDASPASHPMGNRVY
jgi:hypothetical protein